MRHHSLLASTLLALLAPAGCEHDRPPPARVEPAPLAPASSTAIEPAPLAPAPAPTPPTLMLRGGPHWGNERPRVRIAPVTPAAEATAPTEARR